jgi:hypothetical protein
LIDIWPVDDPLDLALAEQTSLATDVPVLLLPVGLSARFTPDLLHLKVRIQPDDVHIDNLQYQLTQDERAWGDRFWADVAGGSDRATAWQRLVGSIGTSPRAVNRAMWIARWTTPALAGAMPPDEPARRCRAMPANWLVIAWRGTEAVHKVSEPVSPDLRVHALDRDGTLPDWLTDYDEAVAAGMAVTIDFETATGSVDLLLAVGLRSASSVDETAAELESMLASHRYTGGLEFLAQGTPTNNTPQTRASWRSDPDPTSALARELDAGVVEPGSNVVIASHALGVDPGTSALRNLHNGGLREQPHARAMLQVLWPVTGGEFLEVLLTDNAGHGKVLPAAVESFARDHAADFVRARGPVPTLRVGRQPYGVLPVTSLKRWAPHGAEPGNMAGLRLRLQHLWPFWEAAADALPRVGPLIQQSPQGAATVVAEILGQSPVPNPMGYKAWSVLPPNFSWSVDPNVFTNPVTGDLAAGLIDVDWRPMIADTRLASRHPASVVCPAADEQTAARLQALRAIAFDYAQLAAFPADPTDLLSQLVQRGLMRAMDRDFKVAAVEIGSTTGVATQLNAAVMHATLVGDLDVVSARPLHQLDAATLGLDVQDGSALASAGLTPSTTIGAILLNPDWVNVILPDGHTPAPEHGDAVEGLDVLSQLGAEELTMLLGETIDLYANRYDAWVTSLATRRLHTLRDSRPTGVHLGGYGWLVNVRARRRTVATDVPDDGQGPVFDLLGDAGIVHAPSVQHAATAAVLRHADLGDRAEGLGIGDTERRFDLTSASARRARWMLEAVEGGQPLAAVLGYRVERLLQDLQLADLIDPLRQACPLVSGEAVDHAQNALAIPPHDVVDGLTLYRRLTGDLPSDGLPALPALPADVLEELTFSVDALADALVVDGIHHIVGGDHARANATLTGLARGEPVSSDLRSIDEMRDRLAIPLLVTAFVTDTEASVAPGWDIERPRATVAPAAERFAQRILPRPAQCVFMVERTDAEDVAVSLDQLGVCALDVVNGSGGIGEAGALLEAQVLAAAGDGAVAIRERAAAGQTGWAQLNALVRRARAVMTTARPLTSADLLIDDGLGTPVQPAADTLADARATIADQLSRLAAVVTSLRSSLEQVEEAQSLTDLNDDQRAAIASAVRDLASFGIAGSVALPGDDLLANARIALGHGTTAAAHLENLDSEANTTIAGAPADGRQDEMAANRLTRIVRGAFGEGMMIAPVVDLPDFSGGPQPTSVELVDWLGELAEVRRGVRAAFAMWLGSEALAGRSPELVGVQYPVKPGESWVGGYAGSGQPWTPPISVRRALVLERVGPVATSGCGFVLDGWVEEIPLAKDESTGLAVNINAPDARPPQAWLLAVPPDPTAPNWRLGDIVASLTETLELARFRAAEPPADLPHRHLLPMIYVPDGISGTVPFSKIFSSVLQSEAITKLATAHGKVFGDGS